MIKKSPKRRTIRAASIELLCRVDYYEDRDKPFGTKVEADHPNARSVGLPYKVILARVKRRFPTHKTTMFGLYWYAGRIRMGDPGYEGLRLAQRRPSVMTRNPLDEIAGIGPSRKRALLRHFGTAKAVSRAGIEDLVEVEGIFEHMAEAIYDHFHEGAG